MTAVAAVREGRWQITAAHFSVPIDDERAFASSWPIPIALPARTPTDPEEIVNLIPITAQDHFPVPFSDRKDALLIGTSLREWIVGGGRIAQFTHQGQPGVIAVSRLGNPIAGVIPTANLAWAAWNGSLTVPHENRRVSLPVRVLSVFLRNQTGWEKVQEHVSLAVTE